MPDGKEKKSPDTSQDVWSRQFLSLDKDDRAAPHFKIPQPEHPVIPNSRLSSVLDVLTSQQMLQKAAEKLKTTTTTPSNFSYFGKPITGLARWYLPGETVNMAGHQVNAGLFYAGDYFSKHDKSFKPGLIEPGLHVSKKNANDYSQETKNYITFDENEARLFCTGYRELDSVNRRIYLEWMAMGRPYDLRCPGPIPVFLSGIEHFMLDRNNHETPTAASNFLVVIDELERLIQTNAKKPWLSVSIAKNMVEFMKSICTYKGVSGFSDRYHERVSMPTYRGHQYSMRRDEFQSLSPQRPELEMALALKDDQPIRMQSFIGLSEGELSDYEPYDPVYRKLEVAHFGHLWRQITKDYREPILTTKTLSLYYSSPFIKSYEVKLSGVQRVRLEPEYLGASKHAYKQATKDLRDAWIMISNHHPLDSMEVLCKLPGVHCWLRSPVHLAAYRENLPAVPVALTQEEFVKQLGFVSYDAEYRLKLDTTLQRYRIGVVPPVSKWSSFYSEYVVPYAIPSPDAMETMDKNAPVRTLQFRVKTYTLVINCFHFLFGLNTLPGAGSSEEAQNFMREALETRAETIGKETMAQLHALVSFYDYMPSRQGATLAKSIQAMEGSMGEIRYMLSLFFMHKLKAPHLQMPALMKLFLATYFDKQETFEYLGIDELQYKKLCSKPAVLKGKKRANAQAGGGNEPVVPFKLELDHQQVAAIEQETTEVAEIMATIFKADEPLVSPVLGAPLVSPPSPAPLAESGSEAASTRMGLDPVHSRLLELMLGAGERIARAQFDEFAAQLNLMAGAALETLNEAGFEHHGMALFEGDDPLEKNTAIEF